MRIKGVNLGSWLLMEGYILGGRNIPEHEFKNKFRKANGDRQLIEFERFFRDSFIQENDFKKISLLGANAIRIPFNYRLLEKKPYSYSKEGFSYLERAFSWAKKYKLGIILDLHAAAGAQNKDWHADSKGKALLWEKAQYQQRTIALWEAIVDRFKDREVLIGYDVLNEPVLKNTSTLKSFYKKVVNRIRKIDKKSLIFLEGNLWATQIGFLNDLLSENILVSIHSYVPLNYTFNFTPRYKFPGVVDGQRWDKNTLQKHLQRYFEFSQKNKVKIFVGEFGINWRGGFWGELRWLNAMLQLFEQFGFGYTYWTYKAIANSVFPDGIYQYIPNSPYINREGPSIGWERYIDLWSNDKRKIIDFLKTKNYTPNDAIIATLKNFFKRK